MNISKNFVVRKIGDSYYAVPLIPNAKLGSGMIKLNETAHFMWGCFENGLGISETADALCNEYNISKEIALPDVKKFATSLAEVDILEGSIEA